MSSRKRKCHFSFLVPEIDNAMVLCISGHIKLVEFLKKSVVGSRVECVDHICESSPSPCYYCYVTAM